MKKINLGLIGFGAVGNNVLKLFERNRDSIEQKIGSSIEFSYVCDKNSARLREIKKKVKKVTTDWHRVVKSQSVDIVIELIGGENPARDIIISALKNNKNIVTANKLVLAKNWEEIFSLARKKQKLVYFEAAVGAGIPVVQALNEGLAANRINRIIGILNGTTNYILTKMTREDIDFETALKHAQKQGFAELNPKLDIMGFDTAHKLSILTSIGWSTWLKLENIYVEGIEKIAVEDVKFAYNEFGYVIKLLGIARQIDNKLEIAVRPCLIPKTHPFASVDNEYNAVLLDGDACGEIIFYGKGAGGFPAASAVVSDIMFLARQISAGTAGKIPYVSYEPAKKLSFLSVEQTEGCYYLRFNMADRPGVLSKISGILGKCKVSIASVYQKEPLFKYRRGVPVLMLTHSTNESALKEAIDEIDKLKITKSRTVLFRIEELK